VSWKDYKAVTADLKSIYQSATEEDVRSELDRLTENRDGQYPQISKSWRTYRTKVVMLFDYLDDIRKAIYTTNAKNFRE
jgi:putative transposase